MATTTIAPRRHVLHVTRAFSAEPTLSITLGESMEVREVPLAEAVLSEDEPDLLWIADPRPDDLRALRQRFPTTSMLVTAIESGAGASQVVELLDAGADLVLHDSSVVGAAAGLASLGRRPHGGLHPYREEPDEAWSWVETDEDDRAAPGLG